jgi:predicted transcriptional regulator
LLIDKPLVEPSKVTWRLKPPASDYIQNMACYPARRRANGEKRSVLLQSDYAKYISGGANVVLNRRSNIDIIADIIRLGEANKTKVMYQVNMSHGRLEEYLSFLVEKDLLAIGQDARRRRIYTPTPDGLALLDHIEKVQDMIG